MSAPILHRATANRKRKAQSGTVLSFTTIHHPPAGFPDRKRVIALIQLEDGTKTLSEISPETATHLEIGCTVSPRMSHVCNTDEGLRRYDYTFDIVAHKEVEQEKQMFPGYLLALTGPSGVGKTTISRKLVSMFSDHIEPVPIVTTRKPKKGDDGEYIHTTEETFQRMQDRGAIIAATDIPSRGERRLYGYQAKDIQRIWAASKLPVVITEMHLLEGLADHFGRRSILSCGLLPPGESKRTMLSNLLHRLRTRGRDTESSIQDRLTVAEKDLAFFDHSSHLFDHMIVNEDLEHVIDFFKGTVLKKAIAS